MRPISDLVVSAFPPNVLTRKLRLATENTYLAMSKGLRGFPPFFITNCASLSQSLTATENNINSDDGCAAHVSRETVMTSRGLGNSLPEEQAIENYLKTSKLSEYMTLQQLTNIYRGDEFDRTQF